MIKSYLNLIFKWFFYSISFKTEFCVFKVKVIYLFIYLLFLVLSMKNKLDTSLKLSFVLREKKMSSTETVIKCCFSSIPTEILLKQNFSRIWTIFSTCSEYIRGNVSHIQKFYNSPFNVVVIYQDFFAPMCQWMGHLMILEFTREGLLVRLAIHYIIRGATIQIKISFSYLLLSFKNFSFFYWTFTNNVIESLITHLAAIFL